MLIAIIDYGSGNLRSAAKAFERMSQSKADIHVTSDPKLLEAATHIVLPGVGAFDDCMHGLKAVPGILETLEKQVLEKRKPFLGVCVGMQMLFETGYEHGTHKGLGWIPGEVVKIADSPNVQSAWRSEATTPRSEGEQSGGGTPPTKLKIPHMGWNDLTIRAPAHPLLTGIKTGDHAYFVHSFHAVCDAQHVLATTDYGTKLTAIVARDNIMGTQFHPEKSQEAGLKLIGNFLSMH